MKFSLFQRVIDYLKGRKHIFVVKSTPFDDTTEVVTTVSSSVDNSYVDVYASAEELFMNLNRCKSYYQVGVLRKDDKKNTANILKDMVKSINPKIKIVTYSDKNSFKSQLSM